MVVEDAETSFQLVFFHARRDWLERLLPTGQRRIVSGKLELFDGIGQIVHPEHVVAPEAAGDIPVFEPSTYTLHQGLTQKVMFRATRDALAGGLPDLEEWIDPGQMAREGWPGWAEAVRHAHAPQSMDDLAAGYGAGAACVWPMTSCLPIR